MTVTKIFGDTAYVLTNEGIIVGDEIYCIGVGYNDSFKYNFLHFEPKVKELNKSHNVFVSMPMKVIGVDRFKMQDDISMYITTTKMGLQFGGNCFKILKSKKSESNEST